MSGLADCLKIDGLSVRLGGRQILAEVSFEVAQGETLVVLGSSGCGKSTLLKCLAGLVSVEIGSIEICGQGVGPQSLYLDQEPLLFEHLNVFENAAFALRMRRVADVEVRRKVWGLLEASGLAAEALKKPQEISGGQKQRVAFVRALLAAPRVLLMDEPFAALDAQTRARMQSLFRELAGQLQMTTVFVTHDVREALTVGTVFGRLSEGRFTAYRDRRAFVADRETGVQDELEFWRAEGQ